jgi:ABC-type multidrug transport system fused ATPase/permease subunit
MKPAGYAWQLTAPHWRIWTAGAALRIVFRLLPLQVPIVAGWMINTLGHSSPQTKSSIPATIDQAGVTLAGLALLTGLSAYGSERLRKILEGCLDSTLKQRVWLAWQSAPPSFRARFGLDRFATQTMPYCSAAGDFAGRCAMEAMAAASRMAYPVLMLLWIDPLLALIPLGLLPLQGLLAYLASSHGQQHAEAEREARRKAKKLLAQSLGGADTIQSLDAQSALAVWLDQAEQKLESKKEEKRKYERILGSAVWGFAALALAASWWVGAHRVAAQQISLGQLVTFAGFVGFLGLPIRSFAGIVRKLRNSLARLEQVQDFLVLTDLAKQGQMSLVVPINEGAAIQLQNVSYTTHELAVLSKVSVVFPAGEFIWVRGRSGCGKTSFLQLLAGFESPTKGRVCSKSTDILLVPQQSEIFAATLRENLTLGRPQATTEEIWQALSKVNLDALALSQPKGLDARLGEDLRLSAGERQRFAIARALLHRPDVLLLDESMSALDEEMELHVLEELVRLKPQVTVILVAQQLRSLSGFDRVFELRDGQLNDWATEQKQHLDERNQTL